MWYITDKDGRGKFFTAVYFFASMFYFFDQELLTYLVVQAIVQ